MSNDYPVVKLPDNFFGAHWHVLEQYLANQRLSRSQWWIFRLSQSSIGATAL